jgi:YggT family protein
MQGLRVGIDGLLLTLLNIYSFVLFGRAIMSWFDPTFSSQIGRLIYDVTEPVVAPIRQVIPSIAGLDLSIMVAIFLVVILQRLVASAL